MKKYSKAGFALSFLLSLAMPAVAALPAPEDSLSLLQREVVDAKKKYQEITLKKEALDKSLVATEKIKERPPFTDFLSHHAGEWSNNIVNLIREPYVEPPHEKDIVYKVAVSDDVVTLDEAIDIGLEGNMQLRSYLKKVEVAESKLSEAKRALFPTVQAVWEENRGIVARRYYKGRNYKLNVTQPVFYGGELRLTVDQAAASLESAKAEYRKAKGEFIHQVKTAYYGRVKSEYSVQYQEQVFQEAKGVRERVVQEHQQKLIPEIDYLNIESQYNQIYFQSESAKNDAYSADLLLHQILDILPEEPLPLDLELEFQKVEPDFHEVLDFALENNPEVKIKKFALESARAGVKIYDAKKLPKVDLRGSYGMLGEVHKDDIAIELDNHDLDLEKEWFVGLQGSMPLGPHSVEYSQVKHVYGPTVLALTGSQDRNNKTTFNLFDRLSDITDGKSAQATLFQAKSDYQGAQNSVRVQLKDAFYNLQKSLIQIDAALSKIRYQEKQNNLLRYLLSLQETTAANLLEGLIEEAQDRFSFIQAVVDYHLAISSLNVATGKAGYIEDQYLSRKNSDETAR